MQAGKKRKIEPSRENALFPHMKKSRFEKKSVVTCKDFPLPLFPLALCGRPFSLFELEQTAREEEAPNKVWKVFFCCTLHNARKNRYGYGKIGYDIKRGENRSPAKGPSYVLYVLNKYNEWPRQYFRPLLFSNLVFNVTFPFIFQVG